MRNKRGQATQVFFYVLMVMIVGLVLILGYKGISALLQTGSETSLIEFKNDVQSGVKKAASFGRISTYEFNTGSDYEKICFADRGALVSGAGALPVEDAPILVADAIKTARENADAQDKPNVFVLRGDEIVPITADPIELDDAPTGNTAWKCFNMTSGRVNIRFRGAGDATIVKEQIK